jgi:hypothetical protein
MKYFFGFLAAVGLIVLVFILIIRGFSGGSKEPQELDLSSYGNTDAAVRLTVEGPVVADQNHNAYQITIGRNTTKVETFKGYERTVLETKTYDNNEEAYETFLLALERAGYHRAIEQETPTDSRGVCPNGNRYKYELVDGNSTLLESWSANCSKGTFRGDANAVRALFGRQVPELNQLTRKLNL